jgi:hypothetical protein
VLGCEERFPSRPEGIPNRTEGNPSRPEGNPSPAEGNPNVCPSVTSRCFNELRVGRRLGSYSKKQCQASACRAWTTRRVKPAQSPALGDAVADSVAHSGRSPLHPRAYNNEPNHGFCLAFGVYGTRKHDSINSEYKKALWLGALRPTGLPRFAGVTRLPAARLPETVPHASSGHGRISPVRSPAP